MFSKLCNDAVSFQQISTIDNLEYIMRGFCPVYKLKMIILDTLWRHTVHVGFHILRGLTEPN